MEMAVSNGSGLAYIGVDFQFFKKLGRLDGSGFYLDHIGSVAYRVRPDENVSCLVSDRVHKGLSWILRYR